MNKPFQVGITGGIGSGKSTVCHIFSALGVPVYDADSRAKSMMGTDEILINQIRKEFGNQAYDCVGTLDRKFLSEQVFGFPDRLEKLNRLVHPRVALNYQQWVAEQKSKQYVLKEAALLFESGSAEQLDKIILVTAPETLRIKRVTDRDRRSEQEVKNIIQQQWVEEKSLVLAHYVINNDEKSAVIPQALKIHQLILGLTRSSGQE